MPKLWSETIESHRSEVRDAILESTAALASVQGPFRVTMSEIAESVGIARATLYKYFSGVEEILDAWHERHIDHHLDQLRAEASGDHPPIERLANVLTSYAEVQRRRRSHGKSGSGLELTVYLHRPDGAARSAAQKVHELVDGLMTEAADNGDIRDDLKTVELAHFCLRSLEAAGDMNSDASMARLVQLVLAAVQTEQPDAKKL